MIQKAHAQYQAVFLSSCNCLDTRLLWIAVSVRKSIRAALTTELLDLSGRGVQVLMFKELSSHPSNDSTVVRIRQYWDENSVLKDNINSCPSLAQRSTSAVYSEGPEFLIIKSVRVSVITPNSYTYRS